MPIKLKYKSLPGSRVAPNGSITPVAIFVSFATALIISGLNNNEALSLTDIMINEFPGFVKLINKEQYGSNYKYKYFSSANNLKIKKWLIIALNQLNLSEGKNIEINVNSNLISINKYPSNLSSGSKGNPKKFN